MKKILFLGLILTLIFSVSASAQVADGGRIQERREARSYRHGDLNRYEAKRLHNDRHRYKMARRRAHHDGRVSPMERRRLSKMRKHDRREAFRFKHNRHHRVI